MLSPDDRNAINGLFEKLGEVERDGPPRDAEAERLIRQRLHEQPGASYYMAQTILVQEEALRLARQRIDELEREASRPQGGFLDGLFGDNSRDRRPVRQERQDWRQTTRERGPWDRQDDYRGGGGGGFLAGAAQTALGVTGGILLGQMIGSVFSAGAAHAGEASPAPEASAEEHRTDSFDNSGGDAGFDDGGGFDMGGDF